MTSFSKALQCGNRVLDLSRLHVMGILNVTPDSFTDGGELLQGGRVAMTRVLERAEAMVTAGATVLDIGGESTRPGAAPVSEAEELDRVAPVVEALAARIDVVLSVDTSNPKVIEVSADLGAGLINDVRALARPGAMAAAAASGLPICLMHLRGEPGTMQLAPHYQDVVAEVIVELQSRVAACTKAGIARERLLVDPGFGFGKTLEHNLALLHNLQHFSALELPVLVGLSRKRMLGALTGKLEKEREAAGIAAAVIAMMKGACIIRTHDVGATVDAVKVCVAVRGSL
jgi:dihydropteroate synthase